MLENWSLSWNKRLLFLQSPGWKALRPWELLTQETWYQYWERDKRNRTVVIQLTKHLTEYTHNSFYLGTQFACCIMPVEITLNSFRILFLNHFVKQRPLSPPLLLRTNGEILGTAATFVIHKFQSLSKFFIIHILGFTTQSFIMSAAAWGISLQLIQPNNKHWDNCFCIKIIIK